MSRDLILALDQGTTGTTVLILDRNLEVVGRAYQEFEQLYPRPGWVSHDPEAIWKSAVATMKGALQSAGAGAERVAAVGITNQRETTVLWERSTGSPVADAVVWQCRRSAEILSAQPPGREHDHLQRLLPGTSSEARVRCNAATAPGRSGNPQPDRGPSRWVPLSG